MSTLPVGQVVKQTTLQTDATLELMQQTNCLSATKNRAMSNKKKPNTAQMRASNLQPTFKLKMPRFHSGAAHHIKTSTNIRGCLEATSGYIYGSVKNS